MYTLELDDDEIIPYMGPDEETIKLDADMLFTMQLHTAILDGNVYYNTLNDTLYVWYNGDWTVLNGI